MQFPQIVYLSDYRSLVGGFSLTRAMLHARRIARITGQCEVRDGNGLIAVFRSQN